MTITDNYEPERKVGNGSTTAFTFDWKIFDETDIDVYLVDKDANTNKDLQTITTEYTVSINTTSEGGTINFVTAPPSTKDVLMERTVAYEQTTDIPDVGSLNESQLENEFDSTNMRIQQLVEQLGRTVTLSVEDDTILSNFDTTLTGIASGAAIVVNGSKTGFTTGNLLSAGAVTYPSALGIVAATGANVFEGRTLSSADATNMTISEPKGATGNPTFDLAPLLTKLASTDNAKGASLIGVEDANSNFTGTDQEAVNDELFTKAAGPQNQGTSAVTTTAHSSSAGSFNVSHNLPAGVVPTRISVHGFIYDGTASYGVSGTCTNKSSTFVQGCSSVDSGENTAVNDKVLSLDIGSGTTVFEHAITSATGAHVTFTTNKTASPGGNSRFVMICEG